ncbi:MAG: winged helix-turn-helix domain-containing protein [bacterium]
MHFQDTFDTVLGQRSKVKLLRYLFSCHEELTGRQIAKKIGLSHLKAHQALKELADQGIVCVKIVGNAMIYQINPNNLLARDILKPLFKSEKELLLTLCDHITKRFKIFAVSLILFGNVIHGEEEDGNNIDILLVVRDEMNLRAVEKEVEVEINEVYQSFGNYLRPLIIKADEFYRRYRVGDPMILQIEKTGKVIYGKSFSEMSNGTEVAYKIA